MSIPGRVLVIGLDGATFGLLGPMVRAGDLPEIGRLMAALAFNPSLIGLGVDEDTAAFIDGDDVLEVVGSGGVTVLDPSEVTHSSLAAARKGGAVGIFGLRLNLLVSGDRFDLHRRTPVLG